MTRRGRIILIFVAGYLVIASVAVLFMRSSGLLGPGEQPLTGPVVDTWSVPNFDTPPVVLPGVTWASLPTRNPDGTVAGFGHQDGKGVFVKLDEATGRELWRADTGPLPESFVRKEGWRFDERAPAVPLTLAGPGVYLVAWDRVWILVPEGGGEVKTGTFPEKVPPVSPLGGVCLVDGSFWIAIQDGRDGGVMLSAAGVLADVRSDRPASCLPAGDLEETYVISPLQNAHADPRPYAADDHQKGYPVEVCGKWSSQSRRKHGREYCSDMRTDGGPEQAVMIHISDPVFRDGEDWRVIDLPDGIGGRVDFDPRIIGYELAFPRAFFDMTEYRNVTVQNNPAPNSFEPQKTEQRTDVAEVVASISRAGELQWARSFPHQQLATVSSNFYDNVAYYRSLLLASHASSPVKNLYIFKPGMLLAVDQATGAARFQIGAPLPPPPR